MKKVLISTIFLLFIISIPFFAQAELFCISDFEFNLDFGQDGIYEDYWILTPGETVLIDIYVSVPSPGLNSMGFDLEFDPAYLTVLSAEYDRSNWYFGRDPDYTSTPGLVDDTQGGRIGACLYGDGIKLGTIELKCTYEGLYELSELWLYDSDRGISYYDWVLCNGDHLCLDEWSETILLGEVSCGYITCPGDFDDDGDVDGSDLAIFAADFGRMDCQTEPPCEGDFDDDGDVDGSDLAIFTEDFGRTNCPIGH